MLIQGFSYRINVHGDPRTPLLCASVSTVQLGHGQAHDPWTTQFTKLPT